MPTVDGTKTRPWVKDPDAARTFGLNWATWLDGDTLSTSAWSVVSGTVIIDSSTSNTTVASVKLSGGTDREKCVLRNRITTAAGEGADRTRYVLIKHS